jgi:uncharacterized protein YoxC
MDNSAQILHTLNVLTTVSCIIIAIIAIFLGIYVIRKKNDYKLNSQRQWIDQIPSVVSSLGVFGTFLGITVGLYHFDTTNLDASIPLLLSGLKTAFMTSLVGMSCSLILTRIVNWCFDKVDTEELEKDRQLKLLSTLSSIQSCLSGNEIKKFRSDLVSVTTVVSNTLAEIKNTIENLTSDIEQVKDDIEEIKGQCQDIKEGIGGDSGSVDAIHRLSAVMTTATESIASMDNSLTTIKDYSEIIKEHVVDYADELDEIRKGIENN